MRTYDDTFSGQKIYPGKVRLASVPVTPVPRLRSHLDTLYKSTLIRNTPGDWILEENRS